ncbi:hypothetical protein M9H77_17620 [Catharanthus roseus]|uniref:Uncharacterized protein n=1 Tax=Catharanthus roseus TaxID=4058 RepID=A0ACC0B559_CATRO|nr:hypothetical protein M9H77_17620 [Catharanthus roseus]
MELMYEVSMGLRRGHAYGFGVAKSARLRRQAQAATRALFPVALSEHQMEDIAWRVIVEEVDRAIKPKVQRGIAYTNYILHEEMMPPLMREGMSYAGPRGEDDDPRGEDDDHLPPSS